MASGDYPDDPTIPNESKLWRRIPPWHFIPDENRGGFRPSSAAFDNHPDGTPMSVLLADLVRQTGRNAHDALARHVGFALASFTAGLARDCEQSVAREPIPDEPAHAVVFGRKTTGVKRRLAKGAEWVVAPPEERRR